MAIVCTVQFLSNYVVIIVLLKIFVSLLVVNFTTTQVITPITQLSILVFETNTIFKTKSEIFSTFISNATFETFDKNYLEMSVTQESKNSLVYGMWSPFLCVLVLASVIQCNIESIYPDCGEEKYKYKYNFPTRCRVS